MDNISLVYEIKPFLLVKPSFMWGQAKNVAFFFLVVKHFQLTSR